MSGYGHFPAKPMQKKVGVVVVEGVTYCQSCDYYEIPSYQEPLAALVAAAEVSIICKKSRSQNQLVLQGFQNGSNSLLLVFYAALEGFNTLEQPLVRPSRDTLHLKNKNDVIIDCIWYITLTRIFI